MHTPIIAQLLLKTKVDWNFYLANSSICTLFFSSLRLLDLTEDASHVLAFNHFYDNRLALQSVSADATSPSPELDAPRNFPSSATQYPPLPPENVRQLPGHPLPTLAASPLAG